MTWIFLSPAAFEDDVERGLLFGGRGRRAAARRAGHHHRAAAGRLDAVLFLEAIHQFLGLLEGQADDLARPGRGFPR